MKRVWHGTSAASSANAFSASGSRSMAISVPAAPRRSATSRAWPAAEYAEVARQALQGLNPLGPQARDLKRHLYGNAMATELDSAGRIGLPAHFMAHANIAKDVVVVGSGEYLELWDRDAWHSFDADLIQRAADHIASIGHPA